MKKKRIYGGIFAILTILLLILLFFQQQNDKLQPATSVTVTLPWYEQQKVICHALGQTETGESMTNCKEAFLYNYQRGFRVFEIDIQDTKDGIPVLRHDWTEDLGQGDTFGRLEDGSLCIPSGELFLTTKIYGKYTPLSLQDMFSLMQEYPDCYVVLDPKDTPDRYAQFLQFVNIAKDNGYEEVLDRIIVQLYSEEMLEVVQKIYPFSHYLYTLYYSGYYEDAAVFCEKNKIPIMAMPVGWVTEYVFDHTPSSVKIWAYTTDKPSTQEKLAQMGVDGIYVNNTLPSEWDTIQKKY